MSENKNIAIVYDDEGNQLEFEELDRIETEDGNRYVALLPLDEDSESENNELIILRVCDDGEDTILEAIEDEEEFSEIGEIFIERLADMFDFEE